MRYQFSESNTSPLALLLQLLLRPGKERKALGVTHIHCNRVI